MRRKIGLALGAAVLVATVGTGITAGAAGNDPELRHLSSFDSGSGEGGAEIVAFDRRTRTMLVTNGAANRIDIVSIADPTSPTLLRSVDMTPYGSTVQGVAARGGVGVAVVTGDTVLDRGSAVFFGINTGNVRGRATTGFLPDSVAWSEDGRRVVVANEGEPRCVTGDDRQPTTDPTLAENPEGSVTVIDVANGGRSLKARQIGFRSFNNRKAQLIAAGIRVGTWPGSTVAEDLEPEYTVISGNRAFITLQENNAIAVVDLQRGVVSQLLPLGSKDHSASSNAMDASDRDSAYRPEQWPVRGLYLPDGVATMKAKGRTYLLTANEGDTRSYFSGIDNDEVDGNECFTDEGRVRSLPGGLDAAVFGGAGTVDSLRDNANLGRLKVSTVAPSVSGAGGYSEIFSFGARSFSIWDRAGRLVWDSGSLLESIVATNDPGNWIDNGVGPAAWATDYYDTRSDDKGPEPEAVVVGHDEDRTYAFIGLERAGGVMVFDVSDPTEPEFLQWFTRAGDISPEGLRFVPAAEAPNGRALLLVANEISGTTSVLELHRS